MKSKPNTQLSTKFSDQIMLSDINPPLSRITLTLMESFMRHLVPILHDRMELNENISTSLRLLVALWFTWLSLNISGLKHILHHVIWLTACLAIAWIIPLHFKCCSMINHSFHSNQRHLVMLVLFILYLFGQINYQPNLLGVCSLDMHKIRRVIIVIALL